jgi:hypothetical protein
MKSNILRINPNFHGNDRHDYVLIKAGELDCFFAQLLYVFGITYKDETYHLALILPMDNPVPVMGRGRDRKLRFERVIARPPLRSAVVSINTIIRGALLVKDYGASPETSKSGHIVVDSIDADIWWRMKSIKLARNVKLSSDQ